MDVRDFMTWFDRLFPPLMILMFPLMTLLVPNRAESPEQVARARRARMWMLLIATCSLLVFVGVYLGWGGERARMAWVLCFLQMPLWQRYAQARDTSWGSPHATMTRTATLTDRSREVVVPMWPWLVAWGVWVVLVVLALVGGWRHELPTRLWYAVGVFLAIPPMALAVGPWLVRLVTYEPEPMDSAQTPALAEAYQRHRHARCWMFFALPVGFLLLFGGFAVVIAWFATSPRAEQQIGLYGGILGAVFGIGGGIAGTIFGLWRAKLNRMARDLSADGR